MPPDFYPAIRIWMFCFGPASAFLPYERTYVERLELREVRDGQ